MSRVVAADEASLQRRGPEHEGELAHWGGIAGSRDLLPQGWREHGRLQHLDLFRRWVGEPAGRWLKTDLFEERTEIRALLPHLATAQWTGIDIAADVGTRAAEGDHFRVVADVRALPFRAGAFDGVLSTSTLDHLPDKASVVASVGELARVLAAGGSLVLTLDNPENPLIRLRQIVPDRLAALSGLAPYGVGATLSEREGRDALALAGLEVAAVEHLLHAPHVVGTRLARFRWYARHGLPLFDRLAHTRFAPRTGHYVAFFARR